MVAGQLVGRSSGEMRVIRRTSALRSRQEIAAALADVVGMEPSPTNPGAAYRTPVPGLAPLAALRSAVERYVVHLTAQRCTADSAAGEVRRAVRHALPPDTPDWSAHLLLQELDRWAAAAFERAVGEHSAT